MRAAFFTTIALILLLTGVFYYVFYTPAVVLKVVPELVEKYCPEGHLETLSVGRQSVEYPTMLKLYSVSGIFEYQGVRFEWSVQELDIPNFMEVWKQQQQVELSALGVRLNSPQLQFNGLKTTLRVHLKDARLDTYEGQVSAEEMRYQEYAFNQLKLKVQGGPQGIIIQEMDMNIYGGQLTGNIKQTRGSTQSELINLEFKNLQSERLQSLNKSLFQQIKGEFSGTFRLNRNEGQIKILALLAEMPNGIVLSAGLGDKMIDNLTDEDKRDALKALLDQEHVLKFDRGEFRILNVNPDLASLTYTVEKKEQGLRFQDTFNIDIKRIFDKVKLNHLLN